MRGRSVSWWLSKSIIAGTVIATLALAGCSSSNAAKPSSVSESTDAAGASGTDLGLVNSGELTVAVGTGNMPYTDVKDGGLTGIDGEIVTAIANKLNLKVHPMTMDFPGELAAVESGRVDVAVGSISWTPARAQKGLFTDPTYYTPASVIQAEGSNVNTIAGLKGQTVGTVTGYNWIPALQAIKGVQVKTYPTPDLVYADASAGRIKFAFVDAVQNLYIKQIRPNLKFNSVPLNVTEAEVTAQPALATFMQNQAGFFLPLKDKTLEAALSTVIREMYADGSLTKIFANYGIADSAPFLKPVGITKTQRLGVDRPNDWQAPSIP